MSIKLNKTYNFEIKNYSFGNLSTNELNKLFQDGRFAAPFLELQLTKWFSELTHVPGNKDHDHIGKDHTGKIDILYDLKNFTKHGLKFKPSNQLGQGRTFNAEIAHEKANKLIYICCDIVEFPKLRVKFIQGSELVKQYPKCEVSKTKREAFYE
jgi:hypothetical protein